MKGKEGRRIKGTSEGSKKGEKLGEETVPKMRERILG